MARLVSNIVREMFVLGCGVVKAGGEWRVMLMPEGEDKVEGGDDRCGEWGVRTRTRMMMRMYMW